MKTLDPSVADTAMVVPIATPVLSAALLLIHALDKSAQDLGAEGDAALAALRKAVSDDMERQVAEAIGRKVRPS